MADRQPGGPKRGPDQAEIAVAAGAGLNKSGGRDGRQPVAKHGSDWLTGLVTVAIVVIMLAIMLYNNKPVTG